jgi:hypothetical protein
MGLEDGCIHRRFHGPANEDPSAPIQEGLEPTWILMNRALRGEKDGHAVILKRPLWSSRAEQRQYRVVEHAFVGGDVRDVLAVFMRSSWPRSSPTDSPALDAAKRVVGRAKPDI